MAEPEEADALLVERARRGDQEAFAVLIEHHQQPLGGYLFHLIGDRDLALDLTQDTFVRAYTSLGATQPGLAVRAWFFRIATNLAYDVLRRRSRITWLPLTVVENRPGGEDAAPIEEQELVRLALTRLRPGEQAVLILWAVEQHTYGEVAATLGSTPDAIRKRVSRAKERFRTAYAEVTTTTEVSARTPAPRRQRPRSRHRIKPLLRAENADD